MDQFDIHIYSPYRVEGGILQYLLYSSTVDSGMILNDYSTVEAIVSFVDKIINTTVL